MDKGAVKDMMFGGIHELMRNRNYYRYSQIGSQYCHWTDEGRQAVAEFMDIMAFKIREAEEAELDNRAKEMVLKELKS